MSNLLCILTIFVFTLDGEHHADCCLIKDESLLRRYTYYKLATSILNIYIYPVHNTQPTTNTPDSIVGFAASVY